jgi:hypothetical protein
MLHLQSFVRTLLIENSDEVIEAGLLLKKVRSRRFGFFQGEMHAFVTAVLPLAALKAGHVYT